MFSELVFRISGYQPPSTNDMYIPTSSGFKTGNKRRSAYLRSSPWLLAWQSYVQGMFDEEFFYTKEELAEVAKYIVDNNIGIQLDVKVSMPQKKYGKKNGTPYKHDSSNFIKAIEDAIYAGVGIDDKYTVSSRVTKYYNEDGEWYIEVYMSPYPLWNKLNVNREEEVYDGRKSTNNSIRDDREDDE